MAGSTRSYEVGRRLVAAGHKVEMVTSLREPAKLNSWMTSEVEGMRVHWLPVRYSNQMSYGSRIAAFINFAMRAGRYAARLEGDVIFATSTPLTIAIPGIYAAGRKRIPMVFEVRDLWPELPIAIGALRNPFVKRIARGLEKFAYAKSSRIIALSPGMAEGVASAGYPRQRILVVPNCADLEEFRRESSAGVLFRQKIGISENAIVVGYAGTLGRINGVGYLVRLAAVLKADRRFKFLIVGDGQEQASILELARELGVLEDNLLILPGVAKSQMPAILSGVDIATSLFLPIREMECNSANKFFDALAAGCCVAINYGGWQSDLLNDADAGIRLPVDINEAANALRGLADDRGRIKRLGDNARRLAEERFSRDKIAASVESVIVDAVAERAS